MKRTTWLRCAAGWLAAAAMTADAGAATPVTGRTQELRFAFEQLMRETGSDYQTYFEQLRAKGRIDRDSATARRVERIFGELLPQANRLRRPGAVPNMAVLVLKQGSANFALPDGRIFVSAEWARRGRLGDQELALLLAHEMAHVICDHMLERVSALAAGRPKARIRDLLQLSREHWHVLAEIAPLMRVQEIEADRVGAAILGASGIPLAEAVRLFDHMARAERRAIGMAFVNSHDTALHRKADLLQWVFSMDWPMPRPAAGR